MTGIMQLIKILLCTASFILLCIASLKINLNQAERARQFLMPIIALIYCLGALILLNGFYGVAVELVAYGVKAIPSLGQLKLQKYLVYLVNLLMAAGFLIVKLVALRILKKRKHASSSWMDTACGWCYEYDKELDKWFVKPEFSQISFYWKGIYYTAIGVSTVIFVMSQFLPKLAAFQATFYPVFGLIVLGEMICFMSGLTKRQFIGDVLGEDEDAYKVANYGLLRDILKSLFGDHVLYDTTVDNGIGVPATFETLEELCVSKDRTVANLGRYFRTLKESGRNIDPGYVKSCIKLMKGQSVLFCNPFYRDLTDYLILPMTRQLMKNRKTLVVMGRDSAADDVEQWLEQGITEQINTDSLWKVGVLDEKVTNADIGILKFSDLFNFEIQQNNQEFFEKVGFVFIVEPSRLLATGQIGLNLLVGRLNQTEPVVYAACDRNCDGLVDALSHTLRTNITEVSATSQSASITSIMCWNADGEYMHHRIFSNVSRYMGIGTEVNSVALKYQIANTRWISGEKFPVLDMKWIAGQYYKKICGYADLPVSQESFDKAFQVDSNLWSVRSQENSFLVVEDEFQNLFEMVRLYATRASQQGFINIVSENYLLRDYMFENAQTFLTDPKAVPTIVADYTRSERNTVLKLLMRMAVEAMSEEDIADALMVSGIIFDEDAPVDTLKELIYKHCNIGEINICIHFREELMADGLRTITKKYYAIEEHTEIAEFVRNLKNAYYIAEDEKGETYYIGAKLYGHIFQALIPGQFLTYGGKYYEVQAITPRNGVVVRRAADHITNRKYYRQIRHINVRNWQDDTSVGGQKSLGDIRILKGYCQVDVQTEGYLEMEDYHDLKHGRHIYVSNIPMRSYRNKLVMRVVFPGASERIRYTIALMLNEIFRTTYPDAYPYICAVTPFGKESKLPKNLKYAMYSMESDVEEPGVYIVEDSEIDLGLITSVERNLERYFEIITELLNWHEQKMKERPEKKEPETEYVPEFPKPEERPENVPDTVKKKGFFQRLIERIKALFANKPKADSQPEADSQSEVQKSVMSDSVTDGKGEAPKPDTMSEPETASTGEKTATEHAVGLNIEGDDEELVYQECTEYQKHCFLKYGYEEIDRFLDLSGTAAYLAAYDYDHNPLQQVRDNVKVAKEYEKAYDPNRLGAHFCDFCGVEIAGGEYEVLKDGRERCNHCSSTALRTGEEFKDVFKMVLRNMEIFYGIKINAAIKVRMTDAKTIARHFGEEFVPTPGPDGRVLGFAQKDASGYSLYIENGSPRLAAMATIAHELTHIWQYQNWDDQKIVAAYGAENRLEVYEGMAKWVEIQYLLYLNEIAYGKREQVRTMLRQDEYGRGFIQYMKKYSLSYQQEKKRTPFQIFPPL